MIARLKRHDWIADGILVAIPFWLLLIGAIAVISYVNDYLNPPPVRRWFADRLCTPNVAWHFGLIPCYKPYSKWDVAN
jgi:hypothetical protein